MNRNTLLIVLLSCLLALSIIVDAGGYDDDYNRKHCKTKTKTASRTFTVTTTKSTCPHKPTTKCNVPIKKRDDHEDHHHHCPKKTVTCTPTKTVCVTPTCNAIGQRCDLNDPGACCNQACRNASPYPTCL